MKLISLLLACILSRPCYAQFKLITLDKNSIPKDIRYTGNVVQAVRWTDKTGDNVIILTATDRTISKNALDEDYKDGALYAYHYLMINNTPKQTWKIYDYVKECPFDMFLHFINKGFSITDLNKDGNAEIWITYKVSCHSDITPVPMKIIMYQDNVKYAARGNTRVQESEKTFTGGDFSFDEAFKKAPVEFRRYAEKLWNKNKIEAWEQ